MRHVYSARCFVRQCRCLITDLHILLVDLVAMPEVPHPIPFRTRSLSPPEPMVLRLKARESRSPPGLPRRICTVSLSRTSSFTNYHLAAGWSSPVARQAHNLKVAGSNPAPAPKIQSPAGHARGAFSCLRIAELKVVCLLLGRMNLLASGVGQRSLQAWPVTPGKFVAS